MRRLLWSAVAAAGLVLAQPVTPSPAEALESKTVSELLASSDPAKLAWGAYLAANYRLPAFSKDLSRLAVSGDERVRRAAVDALLRLDLEIPEETLTALAPAAPRPYQTHWVALHSILAEQPPPGFAGKLLRDWTIQIIVDVQDPKSTHDRTPVFGDAIGDGIWQKHPGFPPLVAYTIVENPGRGDVLLAGGPHPVGYHAYKWPGGSSSLIIRDRDAYRRRLVPKLEMKVVDRRKVRVPALPAVDWALCPGSGR